MSSYMYVFMRNINSDKFIRLSLCTRNHILYGLLGERCPYEKVIGLTQSDFETAMGKLQTLMNNCHSDMQDITHKIDILKQMSGNVDDRYSMIRELEEDMNEKINDLEEYNMNYGELLMLYNIFNENLGVNQLYVSIDVLEPTFDDLVPEDMLYDAAHYNPEDK